MAGVRAKGPRAVAGGSGAESGRPEGQAYGTRVFEVFRTLNRERAQTSTGRWLGGGVSRGGCSGAGQRPPGEGAWWALVGGPGGSAGPVLVRAERVWRARLSS
ncbi:hypothetical protein ACE1SV_58250 [Streptomyces sp. E-15]